MDSSTTWVTTHYCFPHILDWPQLYHNAFSCNTICFLYLSVQYYGCKHSVLFVLYLQAWNVFLSTTSTYWTPQRYCVVLHAKLGCTSVQQCSKALVSSRSHDQLLLCLTALVGHSNYVPCWMGSDKVCVCVCVCIMLVLSAIVWTSCMHCAHVDQIITQFMRNRKDVISWNIWITCVPANHMILFYITVCIICSYSQTNRYYFVVI